MAWKRNAQRLLWEGMVMIDEMEEKHAAVICLHCGKYTPLPVAINHGRFVVTFQDARRRMSIIRCSSCGKEAPYLARHIIVLAETRASIGVGAAA
jgi:RNase P subunit RPR2